VHIQPFDRQYARLGFPTLAALAAGIGAHLVLNGMGWQVDLLGTGAVVALAYFGVLIAAGLPPAEKRAALRLASSITRR
jgi:hypothetical protein